MVYRMLNSTAAYIITDLIYIIFSSDYSSIKEFAGRKQYITMYIYFAGYILLKKKHFLLFLFSLLFMRFILYIHDIIIRIDFFPK